MERSGRVFYGWTIVGISFFVQAICMGNQYLTSLLILPFIDQFQASAAAVLLSTSGVTTLMTGVGAPLLGYLLRRYPIKPFIATGVTLVALGYIGIAYAQQLWQVAVIYAVCFSAGILVGMLAGNALVSNWFIVRRGWALGIAAAGFSAAGCVVPPTANFLIESMGLHATCILMGVVILPFIPLFWWLVVNRPEDIGLIPDGAPVAKVSIEEPTVDSLWTFRQLITNKRFWVVTLIVGICTAIVSAIITNLMPIAAQAHIPRQMASYLISYTAVSAMVGKIVLGRLFDATSQRTMAVIPLALGALGSAILIGSVSYPILILASLLIGVSFGACNLLLSVLIGANFGRQSFSVAFGAMCPVLVVIGIGFVFLFGALYDTYGNYDSALQLSLLFLMACVAMSTLLPSIRVNAGGACAGGEAKKPLSIVERY